MLYGQKSHSRVGQWEHHFRHSNSYEQYYHNLHSRQMQLFLLVGLQFIRSRIPKCTYSAFHSPTDLQPLESQKPESHGTGNHAEPFSWGHWTFPTKQIVCTAGRSSVFTFKVSAAN